MKQKAIMIRFTMSLLIIVCLIFSLSAPVPAHAEGTKTVRVGYYENEIFQEGAQEGAVKTGYAYEYYRKLAEYTGWKYEYVYGSFSDLYQMLLDGEIDLLAGLAKKEDRIGLLNILSNAIKFTPAGGTISFRLIEEPSPRADIANFVFRIKDNGIGMSEEFQKTIFEAFTRERTSTVSGTQGTGLGMAITKNIVDMMGGTISVQSEEGKGSEFVVRIPCRVGDSKDISEKIPELQGLRALVADDDTNSCLSVSAMLRDIGMRPDWTNYGKEAVIRAKEAKDQADEFKVYIIDWMMPDLNGIETVRRIRKIVGDDAPIIILTAYDWTDIEEEAREAGVTDFCSKPIFMSELRNILVKPFFGEKPSAEETPAALDFTGKRILLAEDNEMNRIIAVAILENVGFTIDIAVNGLEAVEKMELAPAGFYDVILMDIQMPQMDGYEATRRIRAMEDSEKAAIPIIAVTANAFEEDRKIAIEAGMNGHLAKPYDINAIMQTLSELLK